MKKIAYILLLAVLAAFTGCATSELDPAEGSRISFAVGQYAVSTKAAPVEFASFSSKAFLHAQGINETQMFFGDAGETITPDNIASPGEWSPSHIYYWPKGALSYINFVSWYDELGEPTKAAEDSLVWRNRTIEAQDNILVADMAWRFKNNSINGTQYTGDAVTQGVPTLFHHMLSRVRINLRAVPLTDPGNPTTTYEVVIQSASLASVYGRGTMALSNYDPGTNSTTAAWTPRNSTYYWVAQGAASDIAMSAFTLSETPAASMAERSILPQSITDNIRLNLVYTVITRSNGVETTREIDIPASIKLNTIRNTTGSAITQWLPNHKYTYNIIIDPRGLEIYLAPVLDTEWGHIGYSATVE